MLRREPRVDILRIGDPQVPPSGTSDPDLLIFLEQSKRLLITLNRASMPAWPGWGRGWRGWRRPEVIQAIVEATSSVPGVRVLDVQSDGDHNRSVVTLIGPPEAVEEAAFRCIARAVRHSSGGLRHVKALGLLVEGQAQVSMNLTDFRRTPIHRVMEMIRSEATQYGVAVTHSELVGLMPQRALLDAACWYLQLDMAPEQVLENRLAGLEPDVTLAPFLDAVAAGTPAPGGGAVAALTGALAAALAAMVGRLTLGKPKYAGVEAEMETLVAEVQAIIEERGGVQRLIVGI